MVTLFESFGNFATGQTSYRALVSRKSRGKIVLTEKGFSFKSEKDGILFQLKVEEIENFYLKKRFKLPTIELLSNQGIYYSFYPHKKEKSSYTTSKKITEELFGELTRLTFKGDQPILFVAKGLFWKGNLPNQKPKLLKGVIFLTEDYLSFKPFKLETVHQVKVKDITKIFNGITKSSPDVKIQTIQDEIYSYVTLKKHLGTYSKDKAKTIKLYDLINQAKEYKVAEQLQIEEEEKRRIERIIEMFKVSNRLKLNMIRIALEMEEKDFTMKVFEWAKKYNFVIDGDYLIVNNETMPTFLNDLSGDKHNKQFFNTKVNCFYCGKLIEFVAKICPYCGKENK